MRLWRSDTQSTKLHVTENKSLQNKLSRPSVHYLTNIKDKKEIYIADICLCSALLHYNSTLHGRIELSLITDLTLCLIEFSCWRCTGDDLISCSRALEGPDRCAGSESLRIQEPPLCQCHTGDRFIHSFIHSLAACAQIQPHSCHRPRRLLNIVGWIQFPKQEEIPVSRSVSGITWLVHYFSAII